MSLLFSPVYSPTHLLQLLSVLHEEWPSPSLQWRFPTRQSSYKPSPLQGFWVGATAPAFSGWLIYSSPEGLSLLSSLELRAPALFATSFFFFFLFSCFFIIQFFFLLFFPLGEGQSVQGAMLIWPRVVCGSTTYHLAHLVVCVFPSSLGAGIWLLRSPPCFSV
jgi:hypothetical protein